MEPLSSLWPISDVASQYISIYDGPEVFLHDYSAVSEVHQTIFAAYWFQAEVLNGGLTQFFGNSTGVLAPEAVEACKILNLPLLAAKLQKAMNWFDPPYPRERGLREARLEEFAENNEPNAEPFDNLDEEIAELIYEEGSGLEAAALAYVNRPAPQAMRPNPSLKRSANGRPPGPGRRYAVHFRQPGPGVLPSSPA